MVDPIPNLMPSDRDQRKQLVRDMRRRSNKKERQRKARIEAREEDEVHDNVDRAFSERGLVGQYSPVCAGIGPGKPGSAGRWVMRDGELVRA